MPFIGTCLYLLFVAEIFMNQENCVRARVNDSLFNDINWWCRNLQISTSEFLRRAIFNYIMHCQLKYMNMQ